MRYFILLLLLFFFSCNMNQSDLKNDFLDFNRPVDLVNLKDFDISVLNMVNLPPVAEAIKYELDESSLSLRIEPIIRSTDKNDTDNNTHSLYHVVFEKKGLLIPNNVDSVFIETDYDVLNYDARGVLLDSNFIRKENLYNVTNTIFKGYPGIYNTIMIKRSNEEQYQTILSRYSKDFETLNKILRDNVAVDLKIIATLTSGDRRCHNCLFRYNDAWFKLKFRFKGLFK